MKLLSKYGMAICCAAMLAPVAAVLVAGGSVASLFDNLALAFPIVACVGMHLVMHRMLGKSCHGHQQEDSAADEAAAGRGVEPLAVPVTHSAEAPRRGSSIVPAVQAPGAARGRS